MDTTPEYAPIPAVVARFGLSRSGLYRLLSAQKIEAVKSGSRLLIRVSSVRALLENAPPAKIGTGRDKQGGA